MFYTYVLRSEKNNRLYTGSTNNLKRRLSEHKNGWSKYTKNSGPFNLIYKEEYKTKKEAFSRELFLKTGKGREFLKSVLDSRE